MTSYCGLPPVPAEILERWNFDPPLVAALLLLLAAARFSARPALFAGGVAVLALLFVSPLCPLTVALFSARSAHHLMLVTLAAPLFAAALPLPRLNGAAAIAASTALLWFWHLPAPYDAALSNGSVYWAMQASLLVSAIAFWGAVFAARPFAALGLLGAAAGAMGLLAAVLTFAPVPLYAAHLATTEPWGLGALADQQLGGLLMWVAGLLPYAAAAFLTARRGWTQLASGSAAP